MFKLMHSSGYGNDIMLGEASKSKFETILIHLLVTPEGKINVEVFGFLDLGVYKAP